MDRHSTVYGGESASSGGPWSGQLVGVTLVSQSNYLLFVPMLPEAATASVGLTHILRPLRELLRRTRIRVERIPSSLPR